MKQRVLTAVLAGALFIGLLLGMYTPLFPLLLAVLSVIAVNEIADTIKLKNLPLRLLSLLSAAVIPFLTAYSDKSMKPIAAIAAVADCKLVLLIVYCLASLCLMVLNFKKTRFEQAAIMLFTSVAIPSSFSIMILFRDIYVPFSSLSDKAEGVFLILFGLFAAWFSDIFALFAGMAFGKHKLCPDISPKKTVEGAIGGVIGALVLNILLLLVFRKFFFSIEGKQFFSYYFVIPVSILLSIISIFGDLAASTIKRNFGVKDFGKLLPGHGGIMDRFDSCLFVFPTLYAATYCVATIIERSM